MTKYPSEKAPNNIILFYYFIKEITLCFKCNISNNLTIMAIKTNLWMLNNLLNIKCFNTYCIKYFYSHLKKYYLETLILFKINLHILYFVDCMQSFSQTPSKI